MNTNLFDFIQECFPKIEHIQEICFKLRITEGEIIGHNSPLSLCIIRLLRYVKEHSMEDSLYGVLLELRPLREDKLRPCFDHYKNLGKLCYSLPQEDIPKPLYTFSIIEKTREGETQLDVCQLPQTPKKDEKVLLNIQGQLTKCKILSHAYDATGTYDGGYLYVTSYEYEPWSRGAGS